MDIQCRHCGQMIPRQKNLISCPHCDGQIPLGDAEIADLFGAFAYIRRWMGADTLRHGRRTQSLLSDIMQGTRKEHFLVRRAYAAAEAEIGAVVDAQESGATECRDAALALAEKLFGAYISVPDIDHFISELLQGLGLKVKESLGGDGHPLLASLRHHCDRGRLRKALEKADVKNKRELWRDGSKFAELLLAEDSRLNEESELVRCLIENSSGKFYELFRAVNAGKVPEQRPLTAQIQKNLMNACMDDADIQAGTELLFEALEVQQIAQIGGSQAGGMQPGGSAQTGAGGAQPGSSAGTYQTPGTAARPGGGTRQSTGNTGTRQGAGSTGTRQTGGGGTSQTAGTAGAQTGPSAASRGGYRSGGASQSAGSAGVNQSASQTAGTVTRTISAGKKAGKPGVLKRVHRFIGSLTWKHILLGFIAVILLSDYVISPAYERLHLAWKRWMNQMEQTRQAEKEEQEQQEQQDQEEQQEPPAGETSADAAEPEPEDPYPAPTVRTSGPQSGLYQVGNIASPSRYFSYQGPGDDFRFRYPSVLYDDVSYRFENDGEEIEIQFSCRADASSLLVERHPCTEAVTEELKQRMMNESMAAMVDAEVVADR